MKLLYLGCFVDPSQAFYFENKAKAVITVSTTTFQKAFLSGFIDRDTKPFIINAPDIGSWPFRCKRAYVPSSYSNFYGMSVNNVGYCNISYFKRWSIIYRLKKEMRQWLRNHQDESVMIVVYSLIYPYLKAALDIKNEFPNARVCCIVLDLPEYFGDNNSLLFRLFGDSTKKTYSIAKEVDSFVLLTEHMKNPLQIGVKPWMLMEGVYAPKDIKPVKKHRKTILYTGKLDARFGIRDLVDSFLKLKGDDSQLWICGSGIDSSYVENAARKDPRITYFGLVNQERVFEMQHEAAILVNPRKPEGEYTKYSFPSKTMEYMASGTPTLMYQLPGMPEEYLPYVATFKDSSNEEMIKTLSEWLNKPQEELDAFGAKARDFILDNKTADKQIARFIKFLKGNYGE